MWAYLTPLLRSPAVGAMLCLLFALPDQTLAQAYSPTHPKVQAMVGKARAFLAKSEPGPMGERALVGLGMIKSGSDASDPKVQQAVAAIREGLQDKSKLGVPLNYHVSISLIFLVELDPVTYRPEIQALLDILLQRQEGHGGWSYWPGEGAHSRQEGDSSQSQYGTLALWEAKVAQFDVPKEACERVANFWISTQTPQGAWGYQGHPAPLGQRANQGDIRPSIVVAGLSSCYVIGELFGMAKNNQSKQSAISSALQKVQRPEASSRYFAPERLDLGSLRETMSLGDAYVARMHRGYENAAAPHPWAQVYYMYAMERYRSFQELYQGQKPENPKWYVDGVEYLEKTQKEDGSWAFGGKGYIETPFAILFLMRSTQKSIEREFGEGLVRGGRGLPSDIGKVVIDEATGAVINPEAANTVETLLSILEDPNNSNLMSVASSPASLEMLVRPAEDEDEVARQQRIQRLKDMVSQGSYQQRLVAVKALARSGDLDQVPLLIYALTDPDQRVVAAADEGLRFISRKITGFGSLEKPEDVEKVRQEWADWYLSIRPDGELLQ